MRRSLVMGLAVGTTLALGAAVAPAASGGSPDDSIAPVVTPGPATSARSAAPGGAVALGGIAAAGLTGTCAGTNATFIQKAAGAGTTGYVVPGPGVVTSASHFATPQATGSLRVAFLTPSAVANGWNVHAFTPQMAMTPNTVNTWPLRVPVPINTTIALFMPAGNVACKQAGVAGDVVGAGVGPDPSTVPSVTIPIPFAASRMNLSAVWEPDVDRDGYGDVSQDGCPQSATTQTPCAAPEVTITKAPKKRSSKRKAKVRFTSSVAGSTFTCQVDRRPAKACTSPFTKRFRYGKHTVVVTATSPIGVVDPTPAVVKFKIRKPQT